jgi:hypothetical protein
LFTITATPSTPTSDADDHLLFKLNGDVVKDIKLADFSDGQGHVDWNHFKDFTVDVRARPAPITLKSSRPAWINTPMATA